MTNHRGFVDWVARLRLWADNPVMLSTETFRALADEMDRLVGENARLQSIVPLRERAAAEPTAEFHKNDPGHEFTPGPALCPHPLDGHSRTIDGVQFCAHCGSRLNRGDKQ